MPNAKRWSPESPHLYDLHVRLYDGNVLLDEVASYVGLRGIELRDGQFLLNGKPTYMKMVLDQGFWPDGYLTAPSDEALQADIEREIEAKERRIGELEERLARRSRQQETVAGLARAATEVAQWMSSQLELADLAASRTALMEAELRALRAQISPHFIYNSLNAIASFVRTDPDRARELLLEFADFTRYSFRRHGDYTTLAEELRSVERYLLLEQARYNARVAAVSVPLSAPQVGVSLPVASAGIEFVNSNALSGSTSMGTSRVR